MAIGTPTNIGTGQRKTAGTLSITTTGAIAAGDLVVIAVVCDLSSSTPVISDGVNTYTIGNNEPNGNPRVSVMYAQNASAVASGTAISISGLTAATVIAASILKCSGIATSGSLDKIASTRGSSAAPSATLATATTQAAELVIGVVGITGPDGDTFTQDTVNSFAIPPNQIGSTGAGATSNNSVRGGSKVVAATGAFTYAPAITSRAWAVCLSTFKGASDGSGVGASSGTGTATGVGASAVNQPGSSAGVGTATGVGASAAASVGSSSGVGAASAVGTDLRSSAGSSSGVGAATGTGASAAKSPGSAAGVGAASGVGVSTAASVGASAGVGSATATGASTALAVGSAAGTSTASGIAPAATSDAVGSASGVGAASGVGRSTAASIGSGSGTGTATGIGSSAANSVGSSAGTGTALGVAAVASNVGSASGTSSASGVGASLVQAVGSAAGSATVTAIGTSTGGATIEYLGGMPDRYAHLDYSRRAHREVQETKRLSKTQAKKRIKEAYRLVSIRAMPDSELVEALRPYSPRAAAALLPPAESVAFSKLVDDTEALRLIYLAYYEALDEEETEILLLAS